MLFELVNKPHVTEEYILLGLILMTSVFDWVSPIELHVNTDIFPFEPPSTKQLPFIVFEFCKISIYTNEPEGILIPELVASMIKFHTSVKNNPYDLEKVKLQFKGIYKLFSFIFNHVTLPYFNSFFNLINWVEYWD